MSTISLDSDQELPSTPFDWRDSTGTIDFSTGWSFTFEISRGGVIALSKTAGVTGAATAPNVIVDWAVDELSVLDGRYSCRLLARRTSDNKDRVFPERIDLIVTPAPVPASP